MIVMVVAIVVVIAIVAIAAALVMGKKKTPVATTVTTTTSSTKTTPKVDTWTGKANTYDWDTAANWSLGIPVKGESLAFDATTVKQPTTGTATFNDNIPSLSVSKIIVDGQGSGFIVTGSPVTVTGGLASDVTPAKSSSATVTPSCYSI